MARGESHSTILFAVTGDPTVVTPPPAPIPLEECCYILPLLVESGNPAEQDPFKNDKTSYFEFYDLSVNAAALTLVKCVNGVEVDQITITDSTYGTFLDFGAEVINGLNYISLKNINWTLIFDTFGAGEYRFRADEISIFSSVTPAPRYDFTYKLEEFTIDNSNTTVFMRIFNSGTLVNRKDNGKSKFSFPNNWVDGKRIRAIFGNDTDEMEESYTEFQGGFEEFIEKKLKPRFALEIDPAPKDVRDYLQIEMRMANYVEMTSYVNNDANCHQNTPVQAIGGFDPNYFKQVSKAKIETIEFKHAYEANFIKEHC